MRRPRARRGEASEWVRKAIAYKGKQCLLWPFARSGGNDGETYGHFHGEAGQTYVHRYVCLKTHDKPPRSDSEAEHMCGNGLCATPAHLRWATHLENVRRKREHGTHPEGVKNPSARLTEPEVLAIRASNKTPAVLAGLYCVSVRQIRNVLNRVHWRHI